MLTFPTSENTLPNASQIPSAHPSQQQTQHYQTIPGAHLSHQHTSPYQTFHSSPVLTFPTSKHNTTKRFPVLTSPTNIHHLTKRFTVPRCSPLPPTYIALPNASQFPSGHISHQQTPPYQMFHLFTVLTFLTSKHNTTKCFTVPRCSPLPPTYIALPNASQFPSGHISHQQTPPYQMFHLFPVLTFPTSKHNTTKRFQISRCSPLPPADITLTNISQFHCGHISHQQTPPYQMPHLSPQQTQIYQTFHNFRVFIFPTSRHRPTKRSTVSWSSPFQPADTALPNAPPLTGAHLSHQQTPPYQTFQFPGAHLTHQQTPPHKTIHRFPVLTFPTSRHFSGT